MAAAQRSPALRPRPAAVKAASPRGQPFDTTHEKCPADVLNRFLRRDGRWDRRMARITRWDRPIASSRDRAAAWVNALLVDHGIIRLLYPNRARVTPEMWRSAQPSPGQIAWAAARGVRTIVNLRAGREYGSWPLQREACERHGIALVEFVLRSREAPSRETLLASKELLDGLVYPVLVHCKSGADRAGLFAALFLLIREGASAAEAMRQLSARFGHMSRSRTGILDAFLLAYEREGEAKGLGFLQWVETRYDPDAVARGFRPRFWSALLGDRVMRRE